MRSLRYRDFEFESSLRRNIKRVNRKCFRKRFDAAWHRILFMSGPFRFFRYLILLNISFRKMGF